MKVKLSVGAYEKIDARIRAIESLANEGVFSYPEKEAPKKCQQIMLEVKKLRQILRDAMFTAPAAPAVSGGGGGAA